MSRKASLYAQFPSKLHHLLQLVGCYSSVVGWLPHGRAFAIFDEDRFMQEVIPMFFKQTKIRSFYRQLSLWGFRRCVNERNNVFTRALASLLTNISPPPSHSLFSALDRLSTGYDTGCWHNEFFIRGQPEKMRNMARIKVKGKAGRSHSLDCKAEKDYYSMHPLLCKANSTTELMPSRPEEASLNSGAHIEVNGRPRFNPYADCKEPVYSAPQLPFEAHADAPEVRPNVYAESSLDCLPPIELQERQSFNPYADYKEPACSAPPVLVLPSLTTNNYYPSRLELDSSAHEVSLDSSAHSTASSLATEGPREEYEYINKANISAQPTNLSVVAMGFTQTTRWNQHGAMNKSDDFQSRGMHDQQQLQHVQDIEPIPIASSHYIMDGRNHVDTIASLMSFTDDVPSDDFAWYIEETIQTL